MTRFIHSILVTLLLFPISGIMAQSAIDTAIRRIMKEHEAVGLSVAVVKKNDIVFSSAYGYNNLQTQTPLQTENLFRIASISKSFSATSIMQLVEQKKIGLDQDVSELIGFPRPPSEISLYCHHRTNAALAYVVDQRQPGIFFPGCHRSIQKYQLGEMLQQL